MHMDGIERRKLPRKLSGVYECRFNGRSSPFLHGLPPKWRVPHSRYNELPATELSAHGYAILSRSAEANVDVFCRKQGAVQLFFQGHPEYEPDSLLREYRRDVRRFLAGESEQFPAVPQHCVAAEGAEELQRLAVAAKRWRNPDLLTGFDAVLARQTPANHWFTAARTLYMNWLAYLATRRAEATGAKPYTALPRLFAPNHALATAQGAG
jgi:homoserine O-succinyltransferase